MRARSEPIFTDGVHRADDDNYNISDRSGGRYTSGSPRDIVRAFFVAPEAYPNTTA